ncbi:LpqB family beta-propeller domain-containing protein [Allostreptomyces psammosilenae]|uniref:Two-component system sensor histidine kinase MtrB n=1 Tax=Allostreptomyces psammosilenae TaxID=1892865 RepID=A0A852ZW45_9ACTN|nr:LpqB family beta-propeller domain-containing protein [Allostreptomyces psammosilenae]NYI06175.1 two-component system sensor histidine kinase MtrB [Allostreptomyces psammosilenae]
MPGERAGAPRRRRSAARPARHRTLAALLGLVLLLSGCAMMPEQGGVSTVDDGDSTDQEAQVRVFGVPPEEGESPRQLTVGFLEAITADEVEYETARLYLSAQARDNWDPEASVVVLSESPKVATTEPSEDRYEVTLTGTRVATLDRKHAYTPSTEPEGTNWESRLVFVKDPQQDGEWRIDELPDALVLNQTDFARIYRSVNLYFFAEPDVGAERVSGDQHLLVPDPVFLRRRIEPESSMVKALVESGPTDWLAPVAESAFPEGSTVVGDVAMPDDEPGAVTVVVGGGAADADAGACTRMAAQILFTLSKQAAGHRIEEVRLQTPDGDQGETRPLCRLDTGDAAEYDPARAAGTGEDAYYVDDEGLVQRLGGNQRTAGPLDGVLGDGVLSVGTVAVSRDTRRTAVVSQDGRELWVVDTDGVVLPKEPALRSSAPAADQGFATPSWDADGNLWVVDRDPADPRVMVLLDGRVPVRVDVAGVVAQGPEGDARVLDARVAADGVRLALLVQRGDRTSVELGRVERSMTTEETVVRVARLRPVAPHLTVTSSVSWAGESRLLVMGKEEGGVTQLSYVDTDGSWDFAVQLPTFDGLAGAAASQNENLPLLAYSVATAEEPSRVYRLNEGAWRQVNPPGSSPVYPG